MEGGSYFFAYIPLPTYVEQSTRIGYCVGQEREMELLLSINLVH